MSSMYRYIPIVLFCVIAFVPACGAQTPHEQLNGIWQLGYTKPDGTFVAPAPGDPQAEIYEIDFTRGIFLSGSHGKRRLSNITLLREEPGKVTFRMSNLIEGDMVTAFIISNDYVILSFPDSRREVKRLKL